MYDWQGLARRVDGIIDRYLGETVSLRPFRQSDMVDGVPDFSRPIINCTGVVLIKKAEATKTGSSISSMVESNISLSLRQEHVEQTKLGKGDRVHLRGGTFEVELVSPGPTGRYTVELTRVRDEVNS